MTLTVGSLFSGIGGFDLGLERAGMQVIWQSEIDEFASRVLKKHWPDVPNLGDITKIDWSEIERPDVICGGYPCQPFSTAGKRGGANDKRHLWPAMHNAIRVLRPRYALMENVRGHLSLGFGRVLGDLVWPVHHEHAAYRRHAEEVCGQGSANRQHQRRTSRDRGRVFGEL